MRRAPSPALLLLACGGLLLSACGGTDPDPADDPGTQQQDSCPPDRLGFATVTVLDEAGGPVSGAVVMAIHLESGLTQTGTTDANGVATSVTEELGQGRVAVKAYRGPQPTNTVQLEFVCGACGCEPQPAQVTLQL